MEGCLLLGVVCLTDLLVVGDQFRYGFHSSVIDSIPLIGVSRIRVHKRGCSAPHAQVTMAWSAVGHSGLTLL